MLRRLVLLLVLLPAFAQDELPKGLRERLADVAKAYSVEIVATDPVFPVKITHGVIDGKQAERVSLESYVPLFAEEFSLYPPALVKRSKLKRIVVCDKLSFEGQLRGAIPDYENDTLYLDAKRGDYDKSYLRKALHHEYFHVIDFQDDWRVYDDAGWAALNPAGFKYGDGGVSAQGMAETSVLTDKYPGFLNHYSTTGVEEDKAEVFCNMIVDPAHVEERAAKDPVIRAKVERMRKLLATFCPDVDEKFWERVRKKARPAK
ncbi:MAG: hypothetical protein ABL998_13730 [Planctomycetota bacterium]